MLEEILVKVLSIFGLGLIVGAEPLGTEILLALTIESMPLTNSTLSQNYDSI